MYNVSAIKHRFAACPCGHAVHSGTGLQRMEVVRCAACERIAHDGHVVLTIVTVETAAAQAFAIGTRVKLGGTPHRIVDAFEVTKLDGAVPTGYVMLLLNAIEDDRPKREREPVALIMPRRPRSLW